VKEYARQNTLPYLNMAVLTAIALWLLYVAFNAPNPLIYIVIVLVCILVAAYIATSVKIAGPVGESGGPAARELHRDVTPDSFLTWK